MWFYRLTALLALGTVLIANYTDLRERIIPNKLTFPMISAGIALYLGFGIYSSDLYLALKGGMWAGFAFAIGYGMWYIGGWAGGDVKLYTALGALLGGYSAPYLDPPYPFVLTILLNGVICLAPVLFTYVIVRTIRTPGVGRKIVEPMRRSFPEILAIPFVLVGASSLATEISSTLALSTWAQFGLGLLFILLIYQLPLKLKAGTAIGLTGYGVYLYRISTLKFLAIAFGVVFGIRLAISGVKVINREVLQEEIPISELEEGMIPAETIYEKGEEVRRYERPGIKNQAKRILKNPTEFRIKPEWDRVLADSSLAAGVSEDDVEALKRHVENGELEDHIRIKQGLPFAPSFGLGVPIAIFYGDLYWWLLKSLGVVF